MERFESRGEAETRKIAKKIAENLAVGDVVALQGDLGAGKTAFVKGIAEYFESRDIVSSPTFTVVNEYSGRETIYHFDAYRLEGVSLSQCDWMDDYFFGDGICIIEWAENIKDILPEGYKTVRIDKKPALGDNYREITLI